MQNIEQIIESITGESTTVIEQFMEYDRKLISGPLRVYVKENFAVAEYHGIELIDCKGPLWTRVIRDVEKKFGVFCVQASEGYLPTTKNRPFKYNQIFGRLVRSDPEKGIKAVYDAGKHFSMRMGEVSAYILGN